MKYHAHTGCGWTKTENMTFGVLGSYRGTNGFGIKGKSERFIAGVIKVVFLK